MNELGTGVPDLLRRFAPTPHCTTVIIDNVEIELNTDDVEIVARMQRMTRDAGGGGTRASLSAKIIRDYEAPPGDSEVTIISAPPLTTLRVGNGTVLVLDSERREILGFLGPSASAERFTDELLPAILLRLEKVNAADSRERQDFAEP